MYDIWTTRKAESWSEKYEQKVLQRDYVAAKLLIFTTFPFIPFKN